MNVYDKCPVLENNSFKMRLIEERDTDDLLCVYSDKFALPFFNSDNCHGTNFYCAVREHMADSIKYWLIEYHEYRGFVRFTIVDKKEGKAVGTIEMFRREAEDFYNDCGILRLDLGSRWEKTEVIYDILALVTEPFFEWFGCSKIATKAPVYAVERIEALKKAGYVKSDEPLIGHDKKIAYFDYWVIQKRI